MAEHQLRAQEPHLNCAARSGVDERRPKLDASRRHRPRKWKVRTGKSFLCGNGVGFDVRDFTMNSPPGARFGKRALRKLEARRKTKTGGKLGRAARNLGVK